MTAEMDKQGRMNEKKGWNSIESIDFVTKTVLDGLWMFYIETQVDNIVIISISN